MAEQNTNTTADPQAQHDPQAQQDPSGNTGDLSFDDILKDKEYQSEFDKRVSKALETAKVKWEAKATIEKNKAVAESTSAANAELTKAMITTELVKAKARDVDVIMPLIDTEKVTRGEKGLEGLAEQIEALKTGKSYLFEDDAPAGSPKGKTGLEHNNAGDDDDAAIRRIMGLPAK